MIFKVSPVKSVLVEIIEEQILNFQTVLTQAQIINVTTFWMIIQEAASELRIYNDSSAGYSALANHAQEKQARIEGLCFLCN